MLLADKRDLQNSLKLSLIQIEEKELNYYTNNCMTIGTQAAMLTGFAFAALVEVKLDDYLRLAESQGYLFEQVLMCLWYLCAMLAVAPALHRPSTRQAYFCRHAAVGPFSFSCTFSSLDCSRHPSSICHIPGARRRIEQGQHRRSWCGGHTGCASV